MALQSSGAIKISEIKAELGSSSNSLRALSAAAGFSTPDAMSEFYGYASYTNTSYYRNDGVNDYILYQNGSGAVTFGDTPVTVCFWVRQNSSTNKNAQMINLAPGLNKDYRIMMDYNTSNNKIRFNHRSDATNTMREYYLGNNLTATGVAGAWTLDNRGNVNNRGFTMITYSYDPSLPGLNGLRVWWNDRELTAQAEASGTRSPLQINNMRVGENIHTTASAGNMNMDIDEIKMYNAAYGQGEIDVLYNGGTVVNNAQLGLSNLVSEISFDSGGAIDSSGYFNSPQVVGGQILNY